MQWSNNARQLFKKLSNYKNYTNTDLSLYRDYTLNEHPATSSFKKHCKNALKDVAPSGYLHVLQAKTFTITDQLKSYIHMYAIVLLRWQEFATRSVAVFCLTYHRSGGGEYRCSMHHALWVRVNHLSRSLPLTPHHTAHVNCCRRC